MHKINKAILAQVEFFFYKYIANKLEKYFSSDFLLATELCYFWIERQSTVFLVIFLFFLFLYYVVQRNREMMKCLVSVILIKVMRGVGWSHLEPSICKQQICRIWQGSNSNIHHSVPIWHRTEYGHVRQIIMDITYLSLFMLSCDKHIVHSNFCMMSPRPPHTYN